MSGGDAEASELPLAALDVSLPSRFRSDSHWPLFARLRREAPVHYCAESAYGPYWSVSRYDDIVAVEKNCAQFSSDGNVIINDVPAEFDCTRAFATSDPPVHTRERRAVLPAVAPPRLAALEAQIRGDIAALLDRLPRGETLDWAKELSEEITTLMIAALFDLPREDRHRLSYWSEVLVTTPQPGAAVETWAERDAAVNDYREYLTDLWADRARAKRGDDIISLLARDPGTAQLIDDPMRFIGTVTLIAGANEAARGALSGSIVAFNQFPDEWQKLRDRRDLLENAVEEIVRWQTPILHMRRTTTEDVVLSGQPIPAGERVVMWYCSGNRDENYFPDGDVLTIERHNARRHLAYGSGIHRCLGHHVARMELKILLEEMLDRFERVELDGTPERLASNFSSNYSRVPVIIRPAGSPRRALTRRNHSRP